MMITFRLLHDDEDLVKKINELPKQIRSTVYREAIRNYFFGQQSKDVLHVIPSSEPVLKIDLSEGEKRRGDIDLEGSLDGMLGQF